MCLMCDEEGLYFAYLKQTAARAEAQDLLAEAKRSAFSADPVEEDADPVVKSGADEPR
jgi:hypothetical protein